MLALNAPSSTMRVMVAFPIWLAAGVTRTVRLEPLPPKVMFPTGASVGLEELAVSVRLAAGLSTSPIVKGRSAVDWFFVMVELAGAEITGASLTGLTVRRKARLVESWPSLTVRVMIAAPLWFVAGAAMLSVRLLPLPLKVSAALGTRAGLPETAVTTRLPAGVTSSPMVKAMPVSAESSDVD